jgi:hypothetical protein
VLPILLQNLFDTSDYESYASSLALAASLTAFSAEAISSTIYHFYGETLSKENISDARLINFFRNSIASSFLFSFLLICIIRNHTIFFQASLLIPTAFISMGFLLPGPVYALASYYKEHIFALACMIAIVVIGLPLWIIAALRFGIEGFAISFGITYVIYLIAVYLKCHAKIKFNSPAKIHDGLKYIRFLSPLLLTFSLGGPINGICYGILSGGKEGSFELTKFVSLYPWVLIGSMIPSLFSAQIIVMVRDGPNFIESGKNKIVLILLSSFIFSCVLYCILGLNHRYIQYFYNENSSFSVTLFYTILVAGFLGMNVSTTTQVIVGLGKGRWLQYAAFLHALLYLSVTYILVVRYEYGALGLASSYILAMFILFLMHLVIIKFNRNTYQPIRIFFNALKNE